MARSMVRAALVALVCTLALGAQQRKLKPGINLFSVEQDVQLGKEYAGQIERQMPIVADADLNAFLNRIGDRLKKAPGAGAFPYSFKIVHEKSINAFALPGGPTFTHTGLITAADNEAQLAGVLAHEIAHVALRHGTNQVSKANILQLPAALAAQLAGQRGGIVGTLAQLGIGLGANSLVLKFSRNAERDADLLGTRIMHSAGYNPIEMARFFEKLEAETGKGNWITNMLSDHPNPGNRVRSVQDEIRYLARRDYDAESGQLARMKDKIRQLGDPPKPAATGNADPAASRPSANLKQFRGKGFTLSHPANWEVLSAQDSSEITIAPKTGVFQQSAGVAIGYGMIAGIVQSQQSGLRQRADELVRKLVSANPGMKVVEGPKDSGAAGRPALLYRLASPSPYPNVSESDVVLAAEHPGGGLFQVIFIAPDSDYGNAWPVFDKIIGSIRFE